MTISVSSRLSRVYPLQRTSEPERNGAFANLLFCDARTAILKIEHTVKDPARRAERDVKGDHDFFGSTDREHESTGRSLHMGGENRLEKLSSVASRPGHVL